MNRGMHAAKLLLWDVTQICTANRWTPSTWQQQRHTSVQRGIWKDSVKDVELSCRGAVSMQGVCNDESAIVVRCRTAKCLRRHGQGSGIIPHRDLT